MEAERISSSVAGGRKLKSVLMFLHMAGDLRLLCSDYDTQVRKSGNDGPAESKEVRNALDFAWSAEDRCRSARLDRGRFRSVSASLRSRK
jgi:hypothetical protein